MDKTNPFEPVQAASFNASVGEEQSTQKVPIPLGLKALKGVSAVSKIVGSGLSMPAQVISAGVAFTAAGMVGVGASLYKAFGKECEPKEIAKKAFDVVLKGSMAFTSLAAATVGITQASLLLGIVATEIDHHLEHEKGGIVKPFLSQDGRKYPEFANANLLAAKLLSMEGSALFKMPKMPPIPSLFRKQRPDTVVRKKTTIVKATVLSPSISVPTEKEKITKKNTEIVKVLKNFQRPEYQPASWKKNSRLEGFFDSQIERGHTEYRPIRYLADIGLIGVILPHERRDPTESTVHIRFRDGKGSTVGVQIGDGKEEQIEKGKLSEYLLKQLEPTQTTEKTVSHQEGADNEGLRRLRGLATSSVKRKPSQTSSSQVQTTAQNSVSDDSKASHQTALDNLRKLEEKVNKTPREDKGIYAFLNITYGMEVGTAFGKPQKNEERDEFIKKFIENKKQELGVQASSSAPTISIGKKEAESTSRPEKTPQQKASELDALVSRPYSNENENFLRLTDIQMFIRGNLGEEKSKEFAGKTAELLEDETKLNEYIKGIKQALGVEVSSSSGSSSTSAVRETVLRREQSANVNESKEKEAYNKMTEQNPLPKSSSTSSSSHVSSTPISPEMAKGLREEFKNIIAKINERRNAKDKTITLPGLLGLNIENLLKQINGTENLIDQLHKLPKDKQGIFQLEAVEALLAQVEAKLQEVSKDKNIGTADTVKLQTHLHPRAPAASIVVLPDIGVTDKEAEEFQKKLNELYPSSPSEPTRAQNLDALDDMKRKVVIILNQSTLQPNARKSRIGNEFTKFLREININPQDKEKIAEKVKKLLETSSTDLVKTFEDAKIFRDIEKIIKESP